ncbi:MAG TPA: flavin reductase family protein [Spirochaetales bacterium]|nr:flavin reductase family protein [Spirochaetales bacterium]
MDYLDVPLEKAYELLNPGGLVWLCTRAEDGRPDLAPVAWNCPLDYEPVSKVLLVVDTGHRSYENLVEAGEFVVALPTAAQRALVNETGTVSGRDLDKYGHFGIGSVPGEAVDALVPEGVAGWLECRLMRVVVEGTSGVVFGEVLKAKAKADAWKDRLYYVREGLWFAPGPAL